MKTKPALISILMLALLAGLAAQIPPELLHMPLPQDPAILTGQLENGLTYHIMRNAKPEEIAELRLFVNAGSVDEDDDQRGLAHFTEHMVFNGTKNFAKSEMVKYLSSIGMGYENGLNGGTSYDYTMYTFKVPTGDPAVLGKGLQILSDMAWQVSFDPAEIERERGVIIEEWRLGQSADQRVMDARNAVIFAGSRYAERSPIGTYEVLSTFTHDTLKRFYRDWYRPDLQHVIAVGDFDPQEMLRLIQEYFGPIPARENPRPRVDYFVPEHAETRAVVATDREYTNTEISLLWKKPVQQTRDLADFLSALKRNLFFSMLNTRLEEQSKKPDPPYSYAYAFEYSMLRTLAMANLSASFTAGKAEDALQTMLAETERVQRHGFLASELDRAKADLKRNAERQVENKDTRESNMLAWTILGSLMRNGVIIEPEANYELVQALLDAISLDDVNGLIAQLLPEQNICLALAAPQKEGVLYPTEERLLALAQAAGTLDVEPYEDRTVDEPLLASLPAPRPIRKESLDASSGVSSWTLANGIRVYAKKTDFRNDEVLLGATSPGGFSLLPETDVIAAQLVGDYLSEAGFGNFDAVALDKATAGHIANAGLSLDLYSEGMNGRCSPKDLELMFQLLYGYVTSPRFDEQELASFIQRTKTYYANYNLEPMNVFLERLQSVISGDNAYLRSLAQANLDEVQLADLERIFRHRFGDFSDFSFVIVGNFDENELRRLCATYLANLPAAGRKEKPRDVRMKEIKGFTEERFLKGETDRCFASHITGGKYAPGTRNDVLLDALINVLNEKLRENIREELSGVYFIQIMPHTWTFPRSRYQLISLMGCSPERVDELNAAIFATLDSLRAGLLDERYLVSARATLEQQYAQQIRTNFRWQIGMLQNLKNGRLLTAFLDEPEFFPRIDKKNLLKAARKYLSFGSNKYSLIMLPANGEAPPTP